MMGVLTVTQAAKRTGTNDETIRRWCRAGYVHAEKVGHMWAIDADSLAEHLKTWDAERERIMAESRQNWAQSSIDAPVQAQPEPRRTTGTPAPRGWSWSDSVRRVANEQAAARRAAGKS